MEKWITPESQSFIIYVPISTTRDKLRNLKELIQSQAHPGFISKSTCLGADTK